MQIWVLAQYNLSARPNPGYAGVYLGADKIGSIGVAIRQNVALHGLALNINTNLADFDLIIACGLHNTRMTSLQKILGHEIPILEVKQHLCQAFALEFAEYKWVQELRGLEL